MEKYYEQKVNGNDFFFLYNNDLHVYFKINLIKNLTIRRLLFCGKLPV